MRATHKSTNDVGGSFIRTSTFRLDKAPNASIATPSPNLNNSKPAHTNIDFTKFRKQFFLSFYSHINPKCKISYLHRQETNTSLNSDTANTRRAPKSPTDALVISKSQSSQPTTKPRFLSPKLGSLETKMKHRVD